MISIVELLFECLLLAGYLSFNGDHLPDILIDNSTRKEVLLNTGSGWSHSNSFSNILSGDLPADFTFLGNAQILDVNGDNRWIFWFRESRRTVSSRNVTTGT